MAVMDTYIVKRRRVIEQTVTIEADSAAEARAKVQAGEGTMDVVERPDTDWDAYLSVRESKVGA